MAVLARQHRVCSDKWKAIQVIANIFVRNLPALNGMAVFTVRSKLPSMNVCVAIRAILAHVLEDQACVALGAGHLLVHASQRVASLIVAEFWVGADRLPACIGVALLACN